MKKYLIVGLGNIGQEYTNTRHNIGFEILDFFAEQANISFSIHPLVTKSGKRFKARIERAIPHCKGGISASSTPKWPTGNKAGCATLNLSRVC